MRAAARSLVGAALFAAAALCPLAAAAPYDEPLRPQFHFTPAQHWMNDPNGLVWADGEWHLFFQYHPYSDVWGPMHWGHAVSRDLLHWQELPVALSPDARGMIFSGSIVDDSHDTSGFGRDGRAPLVAMYTIHDEARKARGLMGFESQGLAFSTDAGRTWKKFARNPVLTLPTQPDFRDPKLFWHAPSARWVVVLATGDHVGIYTSRDLRHWRHESDFGAGLGAHAGVWECPDLLPLPHEGGTRWLLLVSVGEGAPNGGSGTQYFVGDFDGHTFRADAVPAARWVDYGTDDYAGSTWSGGPRGDARTLFIGWMSNWQYATRVPTSPWRSAMTLPRELSLAPGASGPSSPLRLRSLPARELQALRQTTLPIAARELSGDAELLPAAGTAGGLLELELRVQAGESGRFALRFANAAGEAVVLDVDRTAGRYTLDRHASGNVGFDAKFAGAQGAPIAAAPEGAIVIHAFVDRSSIELFLDDGLTTMTALAFPSGVFDSIRLEPASPVRVEEGALHILRSSWPQAR